MAAGGLGTGNVIARRRSHGVAGAGDETAEKDEDKDKDDKSEKEKTKEVNKDELKVN